MCHVSKRLSHTTRYKFYSTLSLFLCLVLSLVPRSLDPLPVPFPSCRSGSSRHRCNVCPGPAPQRNLFRNLGYPTDRQSLVTWVILSPLSLLQRSGISAPGRRATRRGGLRDVLVVPGVSLVAPVLRTRARAQDLPFPPSSASRLLSLFLSLNVSVKVSGPTHRLECCCRRRQHHHHHCCTAYRTTFFVAVYPVLLADTLCTYMARDREKIERKEEYKAYCTSPQYADTPTQHPYAAASPSTSRSRRRRYLQARRAGHDAFQGDILVVS